MTRKYITNMTRAEGKIESRRSKKPPWPASQVLMSLMPIVLFMCDSNKSPAVALINNSGPKIRPNHHGWFSMKTLSNTAAIMAASAAPAKPSQVFFGLIVGAIRCLPKFKPLA